MTHLELVFNVIWGEKAFLVNSWEITPQDLLLGPVIEKKKSLEPGAEVNDWHLDDDNFEKIASNDEKFEEFICNLEKYFL